jgi:hypothetical protein
MEKVAAPKTSRKRYRFDFTDEQWGLLAPVLCAEHHPEHWRRSCRRWSRCG